MILPILLSLSTVASAATGAEAELARQLSALRAERLAAARAALEVGAAEDLRDAVSAGGEEGRRMAARLPGMARDPFNLCRTLAECREAPASLHIEDHALADDAFRALARPWILLQEARGKSVKILVDQGLGVRLELEDFPSLPAVTLTAAPAPTGGFDLAVEDADAARRAYSAARATLTRARPEN
jgi:hypothetical protein